MYKCNEFSLELIIYWKKGWPDYAHIPGKDEAHIMNMAKDIAAALTKDLSSPSGKEKVMEAITRVGSFCSRHKDWRDKNLYTMNQCIQTILQQMIAAKKAEKEAKDEIMGAEKAYQKAVRDRTDREKLLAESEAKSKKWYEENWNEEKQKEFEEWKKRMAGADVIEMFPNKKAIM